MEKKAFFALVGLLMGLSLTACAGSQVGPEAQAIEHFNRGVEHRQQGNFDLAIEEYTKAIALDPQLATAYSNRGRAYYGKGELDRAIADYDQAIALGPPHANSYYYRGVANYNIPQDNLAIADLERALELGLDPSRKQRAEEFLEKLRQGKYRETN